MERRIAEGAAALALSRLPDGVHQKKQEEPRRSPDSSRTDMNATTTEKLTLSKETLRQLDFTEPQKPAAPAPRLT